MSKKKTEKTKQITIIKHEIARLLALTKAKEKTRYLLNKIYFDNKTNELMATNGRNMIIIICKPTGLIIETHKLETGFYDIAENRLFKNKQEGNFPKYQNLIPKGDIIYTGNVFTGIFITMIKSKKILNIFGDNDIKGIETILKILNEISTEWSFTSPTTISPVLIEMENKEYKIKYITMPLLIEV